MCCIYCVGDSTLYLRRQVYSNGILDLELLYITLTPSNASQEIKLLLISKFIVRKQCYTIISSHDISFTMTIATIATSVHLLSNRIVKMNLFSKGVHITQLKAIKSSYC